ncbi:hypothetical protein GMMP15_1080013 [Candidatus Magnetomoraceae bacterium gMMP-15]
MTENNYHNIKKAHIKVIILFLLINYKSYLTKTKLYSFY